MAGQRFQRGVLRLWTGSIPDGFDPGYVERLPAGSLLALHGLIPAAALVAYDGEGAESYNVLTAPGAPASLWSAGPVAVGGWDALHDQAGAFSIGEGGRSEADMGEVRDAASMGLTLAVNGYVGRDSLVVQAGVQRNLRLIDTYLWGRIAAACGNAAVSGSCQLTDDQMTDLGAAVRRHLDMTRLDQSVVAYWVLDDYPGDVRPALELIHRLVTEVNLLGPVARPTICGFGGWLDDRRPVGETRAAFDTALTNFTPSACDAVALYPYGSGADSDYAMEDLLPYMLARLRERGWQPDRQPLIGVAQAFGTPSAAAPSAAQVAEQAQAYCAGGASSLLFYAWNDGDPGPKAQLFSAPDLRAGLADGIARCHAVWGG